MSDDDQTDRGKKRWLWTLLGGAALVLGLFVLIGFSAVLIKWGIIALLVYAAFALGRRLLGKSSTKDPGDLALLSDADSQPEALALLERDRELDKLKARMNKPSDTSES